MAKRNYRIVVLVLIALSIAYHTFENNRIYLSNYDSLNFVNDEVTNAPPAAYTDTDTDTTSVTLLSSLPQSIFLSSNSNNNLISPACLPLQYNRSSRNANANANANTFNYYDEFWNHKNVKRPTKIKMLHMRKAGGTTLLNYFKKVLKSNRSSFNDLEHCEGTKGCLDLNDYDDGYHHKYYDDEKNITIKHGRKGPRVKASRGWDDSGSTLYVTHIREPVARAISHYKYSERFKCQYNGRPHNGRPLNGSQHNGDVTSRNYIPPKIEDQLWTLEEFANKPLSRKDEKLGMFLPKRTKLWSCSSNCYARWVTGMYNPRNYSMLNKTEFNYKYPTISEYYYNSDDNGDEGSSSNGNNGSTDDSKLTEFGSVLSEEALKLLLRYDLIIVLEWLHNDPEYARNIEDMFFGGVRGIAKERPAFCSQQMNYANQLIPLEVKNTTLERLQHLNDIDTKLYRTLTSCG